jgi:hypothetical protein
MKPTFILAIIVLSFAGCCKVYCIKESLPIVFVHFTREDLDTIVTRMYQQGSSFGELVDTSMMVLSTETRDSIPIRLWQEVDIDMDIEVHLPSIGKTYQLSHFTTRSEACGCSQGKRKVITAYKLNNNLYTSEEIYLVK